MNEQNATTEQYSDKGSSFSDESGIDLLTQAETEENDLAATNPVITPDFPPAAAPPVAPPAPSFHMPAMDDVKQQVGDKATQVISTAKQTAGQALDVAKKQAHDQLTAQKNKASDSLGGIKESFYQVGSALDNSGQPTIAGYSHSLGDQVDRVAGYLKNTEVEQLGRDAQEFARQNPAIVIGGAFLLGIALARFFKASEANVKSEELVPIYSTPSNGSPKLIESRTDIDSDDAFTPGQRPISAHGYVPGGILGGAPA